MVIYGDPSSICMLFVSIEFLKEPLLMSLLCSVYPDWIFQFPEAPGPASGAKNKLSENE